MEQRVRKEVLQMEVWEVMGERRKLTMDLLHCLQRCIQQIHRVPWARDHRPSLPVMKEVNAVVSLVIVSETEGKGLRFCAWGILHKSVR